MPQDVAVWIGALAAAIGLVSLLGGAVVVFRGRVVQGTVEVLERSNKALTDRVGLLEAEAERTAREHKAEAARIAAEHKAAMTALQAQLTAIETRAAAAERENARLAELLQGKAELRRLEDLINNHHSAVITERAADRETAQQHADTLHRDLRAILDAIAGRSTG